MIRKNALCLALVAGLSGFSISAVAKSPTAEMDSAPVAETPSAGAMGAADFAISAKSSAPRVFSLGQPTSLDVSTLKDRRVRQDKNGEPLEIGFARNIARSNVDLKTLNWLPLADGGQAARFEVSSSGAVALRAGLALRGAGAKAVKLHFAGNDGRVFEQSGADFAGNELGWSPVVAGDTVTVELVLPKGVNAKSLSLKIPQLSHLDVSPAASEKAIQKAIGDSDSCEKDIVCRVSPPSGFVSTAKSVARMTFTTGGGTYLCTGTLLNNSYSPKKRLFWTAAHCISTQTVASTLQTYWFYDATTCNGSVVNSAYTTLSGGAYLRHANTTRDTALLELKTAPPSGAVYAGWSNALISANGTAIEGIHHPAGDVKKYSLGKITALSSSIDGKSPLYKVQWSTGVTEGGSSGSGLFTVTSSGGYQLRGGLYGGTSYCSAPRDPDYYSRFADIYSSVSSYFNP
ncbi:MULTISPECIES: serine protease [unclassified Lysobacter]|uniref:trypsin-like serine peptidase n=1 Tax=unclassified Lysobacter TaxID=2635362 RepID=UPI001BE5EEE0|nr:MULTISPECIES: serine protease [unclassified Lysobacter]MBT2748192.1 serine protease [Lysobacter sp. ISL-42]MBT2753874.1 serine protease [Lysobacter sp. ISL-50]MBT2778970.1 serine protease [Lysobacter sp. ISL-54]MBT2783821.1 serine protease [Lysobacter sp. ISL-52]